MSIASENLIHINLIGVNIFTAFVLYGRLLGGNKLEGTILMWLEELNVPSKIQSDENFTFDMATGKGCLSRKVGLW